MEFGYDAFRRLEAAIRFLALGRGDIKVRLSDAWCRLSELSLYPMPPWLEIEFRKLDNRWRSFVVPEGTGAIARAVESLTEDECFDEADKIWDWYTRYRDSG